MAQDGLKKGRKAKKLRDVVKYEPQPTSVQEELELPDAEQFEITLPHNYKLLCRGVEEHEFCLRNARPYIEAFKEDELPEDFMPMILIQLQNYLNLYRLQLKLNDSAYTKDVSPFAIKDLYVQMAKLQSNIQTNAQKLDPLKLRKRLEEEAGIVDFLTQEQDKMRVYARDHIGEFTWMCSKCQTPHIMEVPHFAFDSAMGPTLAIYNKEIFELVRKWFVPDDPDLNKAYSGSLSPRDAARILRISPIGLLAIAMERGFDLGIDYDLDKEDTFKHLI